MKRTKFDRFLTYLIAILVTLFVLLPFVWVLLTALKSPEQILNMNQIIPTYVTLANFSQVLFHSNFVRYFLNSTRNLRILPGA